MLIDSYASNLAEDDTNNQRDLFVFDRTARAFTRLTSGENLSWAPDMSADGRFIAYGTYSLASNQQEARAWDRTTNVTERLTDGNASSYGGQVSSDGLHVLFSSNATDLVAGDTNGESDTFVWDAPS